MSGTVAGGAGGHQRALPLPRLPVGQAPEPLDHEVHGEDGSTGPGVDPGRSPGGTRSVELAASARIGSRQGSSWRRANRTLAGRSARRRMYQRYQAEP